MNNTSIIPGNIWLDTEGKCIQAHGGSVFYKDDLYYWYGENKEKTLKGKSVWHWGVRCYVSKDLYNWEDKGLIIPPNLADPTSPLYPATVMDRPHILYNEATRKYICWLKIMESNGRRQSMTVLTADDFFGSYTLIKKGYRPLGMDAGDFDLEIDPVSKKGYFFFEKVHTELICAELTDDYTSVTGTFSKHFPHPRPPSVREAPVHFMYRGKHYIFTSGTTGYFPNPSQIAIADDWHGPYTVLGDPHPTDRSGTSFGSQISDVLKIPGKKDLYIAIADRWLPNFPQKRFMSRMVAGLFDVLFRMVPSDASENPSKESSNKNSRMPNFNTAFANYVWLPIRFKDEMPIIVWKDEWRLEDFE